MIGDSVRVESLGVTGEIVEMDRDNRAVVLSGTMRFQARPHMMTLVKAGSDAKETEQPQTHTRVQPKMAHVADAAGDLDVRGSRVHMVESMIPQFIDRAFMQGLTSVQDHSWRGKRRSSPRRSRHTLAREPHVETFQPAPQNAGGNGVTIAMLE